MSYMTYMNHLTGVALIALSLLLLWAVYPREGKERRIMRMPGMWITLPLLMILGLLGGGALVLNRITG
jgi:hypothetical protein